MADITFEFHPRTAGSAGPSVKAVRPNGIHKMEETTQVEISTRSLVLQAGPEIPAIDAGVAVTREDAVEKTTKHHTVVTGDNPQSEMDGGYYKARFYLSENESQENGIPSNLVACILLERDDDEDFECHPHIEVTPNLTTMITSLFSSRTPDDPVIFDVRKAPFNKLPESVVIDSNNLAMSDKNDDDLSGLDDDDEELVSTIHHGIEDVNQTADTQWRLENTWEQRWKDVFKTLATNSEVDDFKWEALIEKSATLGARPTVLHELAKDFNAGDFQRIPETRRYEVMSHLINHNVREPEPTQSYDQQDPVLEVAIRCDNKDFLQYIVKNCKASLEKLLAARGLSGMNCLHYAFKYIPEAIKHSGLVKKKRATEKNLCLREFLPLLKTFVQQASGEACTAPDKQGNTPVHYALDYELCCLRIEWYRENIVQPLVLKADSIFKRHHARQFNAANESPYLYFTSTMEAYNKIRSTNDTPVTSEQSESSSRPRYDNATELRNIKDGAFSAMSSKAGFIDRRLDVRQVSKKGEVGQVSQNPEHALLRREKQVIARQGAADRAFDISKMKNPQNSLPGNMTARDVSQMPPQIGGSTSQTQDSPSVKAATSSKISAKGAADMIREFLRLHYIRERPDMEAKELLYGKFSISLDKNMFFDATHEQGKTANEVVSLIEKLSRAGGFEDTLSHVKLPSLDYLTDSLNTSTSNSYISNERRSRDSYDKAQAVPQEEGRRSLIPVFDMLAKNNIRTILRLHVDDLASPAHTDAAIERAIRGRDAFSLTDQRPSEIHIETWDWRKLDISIDVISNAAPNVVNVHLYWSGSWSVLSGWSSSNGIPLLYRFKQEIKKQTNNELKLDVRLRTSARPGTTKLDEDVINQAGGRNGPPQHAWVERMEEFRASLFKIHSEVLKVKNITPPRIKVALIDDGINLSSLNTTIMQTTGLSFCPPSQNGEQPWHQSTIGHGTIMANMIARINPWVSLDVMRIHDMAAFKAGSEGNTRSMSALSAAKAIDAARIRQADIISISWSIRKPVKANVPVTANGRLQTPEERDIQLLEEAINKAKQENILIFCSAADNIQIVGKDSLPFSSAPEYIFRIGAATRYGQHDPSSEDANSISYFFPGNQVAEAWNPRSAKTVEYHDGSSVSTALAAGLASLIMYCNNIVREYHRVEVDKEDSQGSRLFKRREEWAKMLKLHTNMRRAFDNIHQDGYEDKKFLPVWDVFGKAAEQMKKTRGEKVLDDLDDLVVRLCSNLRAD
ncbi:hypothetical protein ONZ43_g3397 [Nemania bipapillata]|uniref:Uncharacterized protein n=1 Tax=Nemania bipapillata TaxID=110536 RepID=A0ACC2IX29_9PEZI|nr:hypothetical protein ONZ43_g3397 [Nemania bipapillata]